MGGRDEAARELNEIQQALALETGSIAELFQRRMLPALAIGVILPFFSQICGINVLIYYGLTVLQGAGMERAEALHWQTLFGLINVLATVAAIFTVDRLGRKALLLIGIVGVGLGLFGGGWLFAQPTVNPKQVFAAFALFMAFFNFSFGSVCWVIVAEIFPTAIRGRAMSISIFSLWTGCWLVGQTFPYLLATVGLAGCFWLYAATTPLAFLFVLRIRARDQGKNAGRDRKTLDALSGGDCQAGNDRLWCHHRAAAMRPVGRESGEPEPCLKSPSAPPACGSSSCWWAIRRRPWPS